MDVLVVDDEALVREIVSEGLSDDGLAVMQATSAEHALALTETAGAPDVVASSMQLMLPAMSALLAARSCL